MGYTYEYPRPALTVDIVLFRPGSHHKEVLLIKRMNPPFQKLWALPGGFVDMNEDLLHAAKRELFEETGISGITLKQFRAFGDPNRDPRQHTVTIVFTGTLQDTGQTVKGSDDAAEAAWFMVNELPPLAFDHSMIIKELLNT